MLFLGFLLGLVVGLGFWVWQQVHLNWYLEQLLQPLNSRSHNINNIKLLLRPRLRQDMFMVNKQRQDLQQSLSMYKELLDFAPVGYLQVDEENQLLWCNQQAREILYLQRWQPGQVRLLLELVRSYELDQLIEQTRDWQKPQVQEWVFHPSCEDAREMTAVKSMLLRASSLPLTTGQVGVFLENCQSVLDMKQERDRSFSDLAHELRTPLTAIRLVVETLQTRLEPPLDRWVNRLMQEVDRLINLVQSWLELTQMENNPTMQLNLEMVEVRSLILSAWETLEPIAQRQSLSINYTGLENIYIQADKSQLYQVFVNLLDNSIKYSPPQTTIDVETHIISTDNGPMLEINIVDSGVGFAVADLPHVFERFYRGDKARYRSQVEVNSTTGIAGTGLGLAIVQQIIIAHNGAIKAMNHPETGGAWLQLQFSQIMTNTPSQDYS
ncbi:cell wall metabolism sensor histidine kinase WalK [Dolichospermum sp. UHCC 0259]|uniref:sensor histidine kinase n=1 Tax=Dolichospermum sp. UHCC 0259 TaxID=2590010 RepID=UPI00144640C2|nr:ATP-binding protein [Dolichospermum sp. UHCC 0259]MTJ49655.1 histidine kinase [Dolichospermum sp. UHCC 0259]